MAVIGVHEILLKPSFAGGQSAIGRELDKTMAKVGRESGKRSGNIMSTAIGTALGYGAAKVGGAALSGIGTALTKGFGRLQAIEQANATLVGLGHSTENVTLIMENANAAVKGTAFGLGDAATAAAQMVAAGVKPGKDLAETLTLIGDAATIGGVSFGEMSAVFGKAAASNKVQMDIINQLHDAGVPALQLIATELGVTAEEASKMASAGKVDFATFEAAMTQGMGGAAQESGKTLTGAFNNSMAAIGRFGANLIQDIYPQLTTFFNGFIEWMGPVEELGKTIGASLGEGLEWATGAAQGLFDLIVKGDFTGKLRDAFGWDEDSAIVDMLLKLRDGVAWFVREGIPKIGDFGRAMWDAKEQIGVAVTAITVLLIPSLILSATEATKAAWKHVIAWQTKRREAVKTAWQYQVTAYQMIGHIAAASAAMVVAAAVHTGAWAKMSGSAVMHALRIAGAWFIALGPVGWIAGAIVAAVAGIVWAVVANWDKIVEFTRAAWESIAAFVGPAWEAIVDAVKVGIDWVVSLAQGAWQGAVDLFGAVWQGVSDFMRTVWETSIKPLFDGIVAAWEFVAGVFNTVWLTTLKPVFDAVAGVVQWLWQHIIGPLFYNIQQAWILAVDVIVFAWNNLLKPMFAALGDFLLGVWNNVISSVFKWIGDSWQVMVDGVRLAWENILKPVFDGIASVLNWLWLNVAQPVLGFIGTAFGGMVNGIRDLWNGVLRPALQAFGDFMVTLWTTYVQPVLGFIGTAWGGMVNGIRDLWNGVLKPVFQGLADFLNSVWTNHVQPIFRKIGDLWGGMVNGIRDLWTNTLKPVFKAFGDFIRLTLVKRFEDAVKLIKGAWEGLKSGFAKPINWVLKHVWNEGIVPAFNHVADLVDSKAKLIPADLIPGYARGGWTGPGGKYEPAGVVHADEFVLRKEATNKLRRTIGLDGLDHMNRTGEMPGFFGGGYVNPVSGPMTSGFGAPRGRYPHAGIDWAVPIGTAVKAALDGIVERIGNNIVNGRTGKGMLLGHNDGRKTYYGHLNEFLARVGQKVGAGDVIARSGNTGKSTGPHLHFETWMNGKAVNPLTGKGGFDTGDGGGGFFDFLGPIRDLMGGALNGLKDKFPTGGKFVDLLFDSGKHMIGKGLEWAQGLMGGVGDWLSPTQGGIFDINKNAKDQVRGVARGYGWDQGEMWSALHEIVNRESSWRTNAANPTSSARGLFQKMTSIHGPIEGTAGDQAGWGLNYIRSRYGNPINALAHHNRRGWYADGGLVDHHLFRDQGGNLPPGLSMVLNKTGQDEWIFNQDQLGKLNAAVSGRDGGLHIHGDMVGFDERELVNRWETKRSQAMLAAGIF